MSGHYFTMAAGEYFMTLRANFRRLDVFKIISNVHSGMVS
jgi:hypothetical protein